MTYATNEDDLQSQCTRLCNDFAYYVDSKNYQRLTELFTVDGTFERRGEVLAGQQSILEAMSARPKDVITRHICTNIRITAQGNGTAQGTCYLQLYHGHAAASSEYSVTLAEYEDVYAATAEGWRIRSRVARTVF
jgi:hypothetical protein